MRDVVATSMMQWITQGPVTLVYIVGLILSILMRRRAPLACTLAMCGLLLLLVLTLIQPLVMQHIINSQSNSGSGQSVNMFAIVGVVSVSLHAIGLGLLTAGVFVQRR
jgi:hypothetical protein